MSSILGVESVFLNNVSPFAAISYYSNQRYNLLLYIHPLESSFFCLIPGIEPAAEMEELGCVRDLLAITQSPLL